jgi:hypothetical protein
VGEGAGIVREDMNESDLTERLQALLPKLSPSAAQPVPVAESVRRQLNDQEIEIAHFKT